MPRMSGLEVLERIMEFDPSIDVILMTAHYSTESAVEAIKKGASRLPEQADIDRRAARTDRQAARRCAPPPARRATGRRDAGRARSSKGSIGRSPADVGDVFGQIRRVAPHYRAMLITGETGTGKELVAQALHKLSPAFGGRYVVLNCSAVVETLFESELFGHVQGSFTGATSDKDGFVRARARRHAVSGRNRRHAAGHAGQAAARAAESGSAAGGLADAAQAWTCA